MYETNTTPQPTPPQNNPDTPPPIKNTEENLPIPKESFERLIYSTQLFFKNFKTLFIIPILVLIPSIIIRTIIISIFINTEMHPVTAEFYTTIITIIVGFFSTWILYLSLIHNISLIFHKKPNRLNLSLNYAFTNFKLYLSVFLRFFLYVILPAISPIIIFALINTIFQSQQGEYQYYSSSTWKTISTISPIIIIAFLLLSLYRGIRAFAIYYISVEENKYGAESLKKTIQLTSGKNFVYTIGNLILITIPTVIIWMIFTSIFSTNTTTVHLLLNITLESIIIAISTIFLYFLYKKLEKNTTQPTEPNIPNASN